MSSNPRVDIAGLIVGTIVIVMFFDMIFTFVKFLVTNYGFIVNTVTSIWPLSSTEAPIFYQAYSYSNILFNYLQQVLTDRYAIAVLIAISIALTGLEIATST